MEDHAEGKTIVTVNDEPIAVRLVERLDNIRYRPHLPPSAAPMLLGNLILCLCEGHSLSGPQRVS